MAFCIRMVKVSFTVTTLCLAKEASGCYSPGRRDSDHNSCNLASRLQFTTTRWQFCVCVCVLFFSFFFLGYSSILNPMAILYAFITIRQYTELNSHITSKHEKCLQYQKGLTGLRLQKQRMIKYFCSIHLATHVCTYLLYYLPVTVAVLWLILSAQWEMTQDVLLPD